MAAYLGFLSIFDGRERRIPAICIYVGLLGAAGVVLYECIREPVKWKWIILSALLGVFPGALMLALSYVTGKVGQGDGLVLIVVGMLTGYASCLLLICFSLLAMSFWCIGMLVCKRGARNTKVPYLPFLTVVYLVGLAI